MRSFAAVFFSFVLFLILPATLPAEGEEAPLLEGVVRMIDGRPARGAGITVWDGCTSYRTVTDGEGVFSVKGIPPGYVFALRLSPKGQKSVRVDGFRFPEQGNLHLGVEYGTVRRGAKHTSRIPSNPTTGYSWSLLEKGNESSVLFRRNSMETPQEKPGRGMPGRGGLEQWTFEAIGKGNSTVVLGYRRPWETGVPPLRYHVLALLVR